MDLQMGKIVGGMFITIDRAGKELFEINMYPVFQDDNDVDRVLMFSMYKKKFNTSNVDDIKEAFDNVVKSASGQHIRDSIHITRFGNIEICVVKDTMSYEVLYNDSLYLTLCNQIEKGYSVCYFATRKAPKYIKVKELRYILGSSSILFFLNLVIDVLYINNKRAVVFILLLNSLDISNMD